jgi:hypothetical protein
MGKITMDEAPVFYLPLVRGALRNWRLYVIASEAKQSRPNAINEMQIASVVFDSLAMTIAGLMQTSP